MIRTVTALFDDTGEAEAALDVLTGRVPIMKGAIVTCGPREKPDFGTVYLSRTQREACEDELAGGGSLLIVQVEGNDAAERAVELLDRHGPKPEADAVPPPAAPPVPIPAQAPVRQVGSAALARGNFAAVPSPALSRATEPEPIREAPELSADGEIEARIPIVEEELRVGKREIVRGGARVQSYMEEVPVTEQIELTEEHSRIERRPVDRRVSEEEVAASGLLQDRVIEIAEMREEAVVTKQAFVREELVVRKSVETRVEQVHDTIRRTRVEMERLEPELAEGGAPTRGD
jgi:hypothetical protein